MQAIDPNLRSFSIRLIDGEEVELRYSWPALARAEEWTGLPWTLWDFTRHTHLAAVIAAGLLHQDSKATPASVAETLDPAQLAAYRQIADDAVCYAHTGKTRLERVQEAEEKRKAEEAKGKQQATRKSKKG